MGEQALEKKCGHKSFLEY